MPNEEQQKESQMVLTVAGDEKKVCMIECAANEVPEAEMLAAIIAGHKEVAKMAKFISDVRREIGVPKVELPSVVINKDLFEAVNSA
jgi:polyribonucleotide nucleotidyltransferase